MKHSLVTLALLLTLQLAFAQEKLSREEALTYARAATATTNQPGVAPIFTDVDPQQPVAIRDDEYSALVLPQKDLNAESISKAGETLVPVGQLWLRNLAPMNDDHAIASDKLRVVAVSLEGNKVNLPQCALAIRRRSAGSLELLVFGKGKEPVVVVPLRKIDTTQDLPIDMAARREDESGRITMKILGKYEASFKVSELLL